jgi:hypothetical protein
MSSILPTGQIKDEPGYFGPNYDFAAAVPLPGDIGVRRGDSLGSVINAVRGAAYYVDVIGFGERSSELTANRPIAPIGVNYFIRTGLQCSNGADMWYYVNGIPTGKALGTRVANGLASAGLPALKGLAPGILEDAKDALNPVPVLNAMIGSGYPKCEKVTRRVGDNFKKLGDSDGPWIFGPVEYDSAGFPTQTRWVQAVDNKERPIFITQDQWLKEPKIFCGDGSLKKDHLDEDCKNPLISKNKKEGFSSSKTSPSREQLVVTAGLAVASAIAIGCVLLKRR